ncbi:TonB-dependent receptor plug domain-containing protein [Undibacterium pigrum]|uniref:Iron complex outermembrane receptor protein n=1 Tax=Undibacterium pigrum TaxID=401470 RepID=A0A318JIW1_9BURK|nr:TonB-dependent receptor [Undibacterium pigrum]PXX43754.1 iron complex outermembrane receptor protein [Undibacterium pigrum]
MSFPFRLLLILSSALSLLGNTALAADANEEDELALVYGDKSMISIATGKTQSLRRAPAVASVITAEDIRAQGFTDIDQVLETIPGMHVSHAAILYFPAYVMRGIGGGGVSNPHLLVLQNGIPMTTSYTGDKGQMLWRGISVENISRIEVIRGPGSALYGADAFSGVINIITKTADEIPGTFLGAGLGSFRTGDAWVLHGGHWGPFKLAAYLRTGTTDGQKEVLTADAQSRNDKLFGTHASLAPGSVHTGFDTVDGNLDLSTGNWRWRSSLLRRSEVQTGAGVSSALDFGGGATTERVTSDLSWIDTTFAKDWILGSTLNFLHYTEKSSLQLLPPGTRLPTGIFPDGMIGGPSRWERQFRLSAFASYSGWTDHQWRVGLGHDDVNLYRTQTIKNFLLSPAGVPIPTGPVMDYSQIQPHILPTRRKNNYLYLQDEWNLAKDWTITAGIRHDHYSDFSGTTNPRLALVWDARHDLTAKFLYGRAFRAPAFNESYGLNPVANGNPKLKPERIATTELALSWQASQDILLNLNAFRYNMQDIIRAVANSMPGTGATYFNTGNQNGRGLEAELQWSVRKDLRVLANYSYQRSVDESTQADAGYAPHHHLFARVDWQINPGWSLSPQVNRVADRRRAAGDTRPAIADYTSVDVSLRSQRERGRWEWTATVRNLFNADIREPSIAPGLAIPNDLPMAPRAIYLQVMYKM